MSVRTPDIYERIIPTGESVTIHTTGIFVRCLECDYPSFTLKLDDTQRGMFFRAGSEVRLPAGEKEFEKVIITNTNGAAMTVRIAAGYGEFKDDVLVTSGNVSSVDVSPDILDGAPNVSVPSGVLTTLLNEDPNRVALYITNLELVGGQTIFVGNNPYGGREMIIPPQGTLPLLTKAKIRCWHNKGVAVNVALAWTEHS